MVLLLLWTISRTTNGPLVGQKARIWAFWKKKMFEYAEINSPNLVLLAEQFGPERRKLLSTLNDISHHQLGVPHRSILFGWWWSYHLSDIWHFYLETLLVCNNIQVRWPQRNLPKENNLEGNLILKYKLDRVYYGFFAMGWYTLWFTRV